MPSSRVLNMLLVAGLMLCLLQIWLPGHYLTCDGPCHLYNARIVHDLWNDNHREFYERFYTLTYTTDPNSMTTFALALLLYIAKGAIAEKLFLSLYVITYTTGFYTLLRKISGGNSYWPLAIFIFVFTYALSKGFYNFSFGIAFYFWMVWAWIRCLDKPNAGSALLFFLFTGASFFTHLLPFATGAITCGLLVLSYALATQTDTDKYSPMTFFVRHSILLGLLLLPFILLAFLFTGKEGGLQLHLSPHPYRLIELVEFKYLINLVNAERQWATIAGVVLSLLFLFVVIRAIPKFSVHKYDGFLLCLLPILFVYTFFPEDFLGHAIIISIRVQLFVHILIACCIAYRIKDKRVLQAGGFILFACFIILSAYRIDCRQAASVALDEHLAGVSHIEAGSVILPFDLSPNGKDRHNNLIADRNAIFHHASQYVGSDKAVIVLDNYEANMGYFPIRWKPGMNPYNHLSREAGIEGLPPFAQIAAYEQYTKARVDYVLFWGYDTSFKSNPQFKELVREVDSLYDVVYTSRSGSTVIYKRDQHIVQNTLTY